MGNLSYPDPTGQEPALSAGHESYRSGAEPMLGGIRRPSADVSRIQALLDISNPAERRRLLDALESFGQAAVYAEVLSAVIRPHARHRAGNWHGTLTPGQRQHAVEALADLGSYESIPALLDLLADPTYRQVQRAAERTLATICARLDPADGRTGSVYELLIEALRHLPLSGRNTIATILAAAPPDLVLRPLLLDGLSAPEIPARRETARALGMLGDRRATRRLLDLLRDPSPTVRASAAWALGQLDAPVAIPGLIEATRDPDEVARGAAVEALGGQAARIDPYDDQFRAAIARLSDALADPDMSVRLAALEALGGINQPAARVALQALRNRGTGR